MDGTDQMHYGLTALFPSPFGVRHLHQVHFHLAVLALLVVQSGKNWEINLTSLQRIGGDEMTRWFTRVNVVGMKGRSL